MVKEAESQGAELVVGGEPDNSTGELFYKPTILTNVSR